MSLSLGRTTHQIALLLKVEIAFVLKVEVALLNLSLIWIEIALLKEVAIRSMSPVSGH